MAQKSLEAQLDDNYNRKRKAVKQPFIHGVNQIKPLCYFGDEKASG